MYDPLFVQAELDYRRERSTRGTPVAPRRPVRLRLPFVGRGERTARHAR